jgi:hypothetical protein
MEEKINMSHFASSSDAKFRDIAFASPSQNFHFSILRFGCKPDACLQQSGSFTIHMAITAPGSLRAR